MLREELPLCDGLPRYQDQDRHEVALDNLDQGDPTACPIYSTIAVEWTIYVLWAAALTTSCQPSDFGNTAFITPPFGWEDLLTQVFYWAVLL